MRKTFVAFVIVLVAAAAGAAHSAEVVRLGADNWDRAPKGKETDAIYGDYLLTNGIVSAAIADAKPGRMGNTMMPDASGVLLDFTTAAGGNDMLTGFIPGDVIFTAVKVVKASGPEAIVEARRAATATDPVEIVVEYKLADNQSYIVVTTRARNTGDKPVELKCCDRLRADGNFSQAVIEEGDAFWAYDKWYDGAYAVYSTAGRIASGTREKGYDRGKTISYSGVAKLKASAAAQPAADAPAKKSYAGKKGAAPAPAGPMGTEFDLAPGQELVWTCYLLTGRDQIDLLGQLLALRGKPAASATLKVAEPSGAPVADANVTVSRDGKQLAAGQTGADGMARLTLEPGKYSIAIDSLGRPSQTVELDLAAGPKDEVAVTMPAASGVDVVVTTEDGKPIPCKTQFLAADAKNDPDFGPHCMARGIKNLYLSESGRFRQALAPGAYKVVISHGPEFDAVIMNIEVAAGQFTPVRAQLKRVLDTRGWIGADLHGHTTNSGDNFADMDGRVISLAAEGIEFAPSTDHVSVVDWQPAIDRLGLGSWLSTVCGQEISGPGAKTHQNAFPLPYRPREQAGGGIPAGGDLDEQVSRIAKWNNSSEKLIQFNHPDVMRGFFDKDGDGKYDGGYQVAEKFFHCMESMGNPLAPQSGGRRNRAQSWLLVLNKGLRITGTANTDSHTTFHGSGYQRSFIRCSTDDPAKIDAMEIVRAVKAGHVVMSTGPFMEVTAGQALPGHDLKAPDGRVTLHVKVQCPNWLDVDRVAVLANGRPLDEATFTRAKHAAMFGGTEQVVRFEQDIAVALKGDAHLIVVADGEGLSMAPVMGGRESKGAPVAVSNPIYVDVDGGGFKANGDMLGAKLAAALDEGAEGE